jgi:hypothetical protein
MNTRMSAIATGVMLITVMSRNSRSILLSILQGGRTRSEPVK